MSAIVEGLTQAGEFMADHIVWFMAGAGAVAAAALAFAARRVSRGADVSQIVTWGAVGLVTAFSAEGMWEVATETLELTAWQAGVLFVTLEAAMTSCGLKARARLAAQKPAALFVGAVWLIAAFAGLVACSNAETWTERLLRLGIPLLAAGLWWLELRSQVEAKPAGAITWKLTPRRVLVRLGVAEPGDLDVEQVHRTHHVQALTNAAFRTHKGLAQLRGMRTRRLQRLALRADEGMVTEAVERLRRTYEIETITAPRTATDTATPSATGTDTTAATATATRADTEGATQQSPTRRQRVAGSAGVTDLRSRTKKDGKSAKDVARRYWDTKRKQGSTPTGGELARAAGVNPSLGRRWAAAWRAEPGEEAS